MSSPGRKYYCDGRIWITSGATLFASVSAERGDNNQFWKAEYAQETRIRKGEEKEMIPGGLGAIKISGSSPLRFLMLGLYLYKRDRMRRVYFHFLEIIADLFAVVAVKLYKIIEQSFYRSSR